MKWNIGIIKNIDKILSNDKLNIYKDINILFLDKYIKINFGIADPFIFKNYIFGETLHYRYLNKEINNGKNLKNQYKSNIHKGGIIVVGKFINNRDILFKEIISDKNFHFSYPHIFKYENDIYMIPETYQSVNLKLYKCISFPYKWTFIRNLIDIGLCDSTIFKIEETYYIFTRTVKQNINECETLLYKFNNILKDDLILVKKNILPNGYRGGGNVFKMNNKLYIPIQPISEKYGENLEIYEIVNENNNIIFKFNNKINYSAPIKGIHHLSNYNGVFICDYYI